MTERMTDAEIERIEQRLTDAGLGMQDDPQSIAKLTLKEITDAVMALRQLLEERKWRPIEEAPKDGSWFEAFYPKESPVPLAESFKPARWVEGFFDGKGGFLDIAEHEEFEQPTRWRLLPTPPQEEGA